MASVIVGGALMAGSACGSGGAAADGSMVQGTAGAVGSGGAGGSGRGASGGAGTGDTGGGGAGGGAGSGPAGPWAPQATTNDAATLTGGQVGNCPGTAPMRKKIPVTVNGGSADFVVGDAYLVATDPLHHAATLFSTVTNRGTKMHCNVAPPPNGYDWYDAQGRSLGITGGPNVLGSEGDVGMPYYTQSCLMPGETGMIVDARQPPITVDDMFVATTRISIALAYQQDGVPPAAALVPQSFTGDGVKGFLVRFRNDGSAAAGMPMGEYGTFVMMDGGGLPLAWGGFNESPDDAFTYQVKVGASGSGLSNAADACASTIRAYVKFESLAAPHP